MKIIKTHTLAVTLALAALLSNASYAGASGPPAPENRMLSKKEVKTLVATAKTPEDHRRLAAHFEAKAERFEAEAAEHEQLAKEYRRNPLPTASKMPMSPRSAEHCEFFAKSARDAAKAARELAADHRAMAAEASK